MRRAFSLAAILLLPLLAHGQDIAPTVTIKLDKATAKAGEQIKGTVTATFAPGLHGYQNPPTDPNSLPVKLTAGAGTTLVSVKYPAGHMERVAGADAAVYSGTVSFPFVATVSSTSGQQKLNVDFFYQQCNEETCYRPQTIALSTTVTVTVAESAIKPRPATKRATFDATVPETVEVGKPLVINVKLAVPTGMSLQLAPKGPRVFVDAPFKLSSFEFPGIPKPKANAKAQVTGSAQLAITFEPNNVPGDWNGKYQIEYVLADKDGEFLPVRESLSFKTKVVTPPDEPAMSMSDPGPSAPTEIKTPPQQPSAGSEGGLLGFLNKALEEGNWALIIPAALLVGLALCLTPCVFPMIPITVSFFSNQGAKTTAGRFSLGLFYALGIAITYGAAGGIAAASKYAVGELFTKSWFLFALGALMVALALSMFDVYEIRLPGFIQKNLKGRSGPAGALIMGLLMGFAAAPCAGALVGAVAVKVANIGSIPVGLGMFGLIGIGMGLPFMALATASSGAKVLPKSGGWLKTTKAVLGLVVLYLAFDYLFKGVGLSPGKASTQIAWIVVFAGFAFYLLFLDKSDATKAVNRIKGVTAVGLGILAGLSYASYKQITFDEDLAKQLAAKKGNVASDSQVVGKTINWIPYNDENFAKAVASGKPIMIDGRADWCLICHEMENRVFKTPEGLVALSDIYLLEIDWSTNVPQDYIDMTKKRFNILGLPHVVFMKPGGKDEFSVGDIKDVAELKGYLKRIGATS